jgi:hypothetical protein
VGFASQLVAHVILAKPMSVEAMLLILTPLQRERTTKTHRATRPFSRNKWRPVYWTVTCHYAVLLCKSMDLMALPRRN